MMGSEFISTSVQSHVSETLTKLTQHCVPTRKCFYYIPINDTPFEQHVFCSSDTERPINQSPVVQSIVSLTSSLRGQLVKCFATS